MAKTAQELLAQKKFDPLLGELVDTLGCDDAAQLWVRAERRLDALLAGTQELPELERAHVCDFIYPTCALYLELSAVLGREQALDTLMAFAHNLALENRQHFAAITSTRLGARFFIWAFGALQPLLFGTNAGFEVTQGEATTDHVHFEISSCPYQRHTAALGVPELCNLFCTNDDIIYGNLPNVRFSRNGTLGRGAAVCDFDVQAAFSQSD